MAEEQKQLQLATASFISGAVSNYGNYYSGLDATNQSLGLAPEKLIIPRDYNSVIRMCYDFYQRGGMASTVVNRLTEMTITTIRNGQRKTSNEANEYFDAVLHRNPSRMMRFIRTAALEYFLSGMVLPKVDWVEVEGQDISPKLKNGKKYVLPVFDLYPPLLINVIWASWGKKEYYLKLPREDIKLIRNGGSQIKEQQLKLEMYQNYYPSFIQAIVNGADRIKIDVDPILRREVSFNPYPTPYLFNVLEALVFKQGLRRMDFAVVTRVINAILLVQEGDKDFPLTTETEKNLAELKSQILARAGDPRLLERLFFLFSNHTTKLTWVSPDIEALLNQEKYHQTNEEISEGLGFARVLITGESGKGSATDVSTWAIQPMMEEVREMLIEWMETVYEEAADLNNFRSIPQPTFSTIKLQDFVKTAAVFAQAYREGNVSRTTRDEMIGLDFETEVELMIDEFDGIKELPKNYPDMPYNTQVAPGIGGSGGAPNRRTGGRPLGTQDTPTTPRKVGVTTTKEMPMSRLKQTTSPTTKTKASDEMLSDEEVINLIDRIAEERGLSISLEDLGLEKTP